jgi:hypothetical protein
MASPAQVAANRENSLRSTGPVTPSGKAASSQNALRHGLTSTRVVLPGEDAAAFDALRDGLLHDYAPANDFERLLVEELAAASWRLQRARAVETAFLAKLGEGADNPERAIAAALLEKPKELDRLIRYINTYDRAFYRAHDKLQKVQRERKQEEHSRALEQAWVAQVRAKAEAETLAKQNGFVSRNPEQPSLHTSAQPASLDHRKVVAAPAGPEIANHAR